MDDKPKSIEEKQEVPEKCPITGLMYWGLVEDDETHELVPVYGSPFDSYTIPIKDEDGNYTTKRFCHDRGEWVGYETIYLD